MNTLNLINMILISILFFKQVRDKKIFLQHAKDTNYKIDKQNFTFTNSINIISENFNSLERELQRLINNSNKPKISNGKRGRPKKIK
jgi:hypothetical protein